MMQQPFFYPYTQQGAYPFAFPGYKQPCTYKQFLDCKPSEYKGSSDPNVTLNWLCEMIKALDAYNCENELKVKYATRMLKGDAMVWWDSITGHFTEQQQESITWSQFQEKLCEQYCSSFEIAKIKKEFMDLKMTGNMSVDDLIKQFNERLRFVKQWVPDEASQIAHFVGALHPDYRSATRWASTLS